MKDGSKPTYVQVTDKRGTLAGWKLTLSQPEQFKTATGEELVGAQLTFTKAEAASMVDEKYKPTEVSSTISLTPGVNNNLAMNAKKKQVLGLGFIALVQMKQQIKKLSNYSFPENL